MVKYVLIKPNRILVIIIELEILQLERLIEVNEVRHLYKYSELLNRG
jgi:hypothetical protein